MNIKQKITFIGTLVILAILGFANLGNANQFFFPPTSQSGGSGTNASTTVNYFGTGTATTTLVTRDSYGNGQPLATDRGTLLIQMTASSTASVLNATFEYSQDGVDWYTDNLTTTSGTNNISAPVTYSWTAAGTATSSKAINIQMPTRYVRVKSSVSGAGAAVWMQIVPEMQGRI